MTKRRMQLVPKGGIYPFLFIVQEKRCFHCREPLAARKHAGKLAMREWTREHLFGALGGVRDGNWVVLACEACNSYRGIKTPSEEEVARARNIIEQARLLHQQFVLTAYETLVEPLWWLEIKGKGKEG